MIINKECMGCGACIEICPMKCIHFDKNEGFEKIVIEHEKCIKCNLCNSVCQLENDLVQHDIKELYVACQKDENNIKNSTSGGLATLLSQKMIDLGWVVVGVAWNENCEANYDIAFSKEDIEKFRGSKYVYPKMNNIYKKTREISTTKKVLFIGLPCHIAAIKMYMKQNMENIYTIDLICHGAPQSSFLKEHLEKIGFDYFSNISFRENREYVINVWNNNRKYRAKHYEDVYLYGFLNGLIQKKYCYSCKYAYSKRIGDITLGDSWNKTLKDLSHTNLLSINTDKGIELVKYIENNVILEKYDLNIFNNKDSQMKYPTKMHKKRLYFEKIIKRGNFEYACKKVLFKEMMCLKVKKYLSKIKKYVKGVS